MKDLDQPEDISIHAPTRGATLCSGIYSPGVIISIHAPTRGATMCLDCAFMFPMIFQSTLLQEERRRRVHGCWNFRRYFNPRSYKRSDNFSSSYFPFTSISIHAPTRGATMFTLTTANSLSRFQSTLLQEERPRLRHHKNAWIYFNPRSYKRSDNKSSTTAQALMISIHAPTRGATLLP